MPADKPTELSRIKLKTWTRQPVPMISEHSAHSTPHTYIHTYLLLLISMLWHRQAIFESKGDKLSSSAECRIRTQRVPETQSSADWMPADKPTELSRIKLKTWTRQPVPMISIYVHTYVRTFVRTYVRTYVHTYIHTYIHTRTRTHVHTYMRTRAHAYTRTRIHTYTYTYTHTYMHTTHIAFRSIRRRCHMQPYLLFTIHVFFNVLCIIIWLSEHRAFLSSFVLNALWSVTVWHCYLKNWQIAICLILVAFRTFDLKIKHGQK